MLITNQAVSKDEHVLFPHTDEEMGGTEWSNLPNIIQLVGGRGKIQSQPFWLWSSSSKPLQPLLHSLSLSIHWNKASIWTISLQWNYFAKVTNDSYLSQLKGHLSASAFFIHSAASHQIDNPPLLPYICIVKYHKSVLRSTSNVGPHFLPINILTRKSPTIP